MFSNLLRALDEGFERASREKRYLLAYRDDHHSLFLLDTETSKSVWEKEVPYIVSSAAIGEGGLYIYTNDEWIYAMEAGKRERISRRKIQLINQLIVRDSTVFALRYGELIDLSNEERMRIDAPGIEYAEWIFSDGERDYLHYTIGIDNFIIAEFDMETGRTGEKIFKGGCKGHAYRSQSEMVGEWLLTVGENKTLMAVKQLGDGWELNGRLYAPQGELHRFVVVEKEDGLEVYVDERDFVRVVADREFRGARVETLMKGVNGEGYFRPLLLLSAYEAGAYLGAEVE